MSFDLIVKHSQKIELYIHSILIIHSYTTLSLSTLCLSVCLSACLSLSLSLSLTLSLSHSLSRSLARCNTKRFIFHTTKKTALLLRVRKSDNARGGEREGGPFRASQMLLGGDRGCGGRGGGREMDFQALQMHLDRLGPQSVRKTRHLPSQIATCVFFFSPADFLLSLSFSLSCLKHTHTHTHTHARARAWGYGL